MSGTRGYDREGFLAEFFPDAADRVEVGAEVLINVSRAHRLAEMRKRLGLTQAEVAERMNVRQERVSAIERAKVDASELRTLAAYIRALGGHMEIVADFGGERLFRTSEAQEVDLVLERDDGMVDVVTRKRERPPPAARDRGRRPAEHRKDRERTPSITRPGSRP